MANLVDANLDEVREVGTHTVQNPVNAWGGAEQRIYLNVIADPLGTGVLLQQGANNSDRSTVVAKRSSTNVGWTPWAAQGPGPIPEPPEPELALYLSCPEAASATAPATVKWSGAGFSGKANLTMQQAADSSFGSPVDTPVTVYSDNLLEAEMEWAVAPVDTYVRLVDTETMETSNIMRFGWHL